MYKLLSPVEFSITVSAATLCPVKKLDTPFYSLDLPMILHMFDDISLKHVYGGGGGGAGLVRKIIRSMMIYWQSMEWPHWESILRKTTYKILVQSTLEYATCNWSPHIQGTHPTNTKMRYLRLVTPHTRYSSNQHWSMLLAPGHPTYKVFVQPTLKCATCAWSPHIQGTHPTNARVCYLHLVTTYTRYSPNQRSCMLLAPGHPTYKVFVQPTLEYATCTWSPHIQGTHPTIAGVCYLHLVTPHTRYSSNQRWSMLLAPGHPTYKVLAQPTLMYATCAWSPHIQGIRPTNT